MSTGLYPNNEVVERWLAGAVSAQTITQPFVVPYDCDVIGMVLRVGTAPGGSNTFNVNISTVPTSQLGTGLETPNPYNLWTSANVPTVTGTAQMNWVQNSSNVFYGTQSLIENIPYALNYPLPGPGGSTGFVTAQSTAQTTTNPVLSPPVVTRPSMSALVAPDNTYTDLNGLSAAASVIHAGDILSFVIAGGSPGSAANLQMQLILAKR